MFRLDYRKWTWMKRGCSSQIGFKDHETLIATFLLFIYTKYTSSEVYAFYFSIVSYEETKEANETDYEVA